jgi:predicted aspartyl protease
MITGAFTGDIPIVQVVVTWGQSVQSPFVVLDTGFTGDIQVTSQIAKELGLEINGVTKARIANGQTITVSSALALASMEGKTDYINVLISESMPLVGISFLTKFGYKAIVDCKYRTVVLEKAK